MTVAARRRSLTRNGALAALGFGIVCSAAGWAWAAVLIAFFISGTLLTRYKRDRKSDLTASVVAKDGERDARQVFANGGLFTAAAMASIVDSSLLWPLVGVGAIAASTADTWATEIGMLSSAPPRSILSGAVVTAGQSGGVTWTGSLGGAAGAGFIASITFVAGWGAPAATAAILGGIGSSVFDSVLGASLQTRRWCDRCNVQTERTIHGCGTTTLGAGGLSWLDNDAVNAAASGFGALIGILCFLATR